MAVHRHSRRMTPCPRLISGSGRGPFSLRGRTLTLARCDHFADVRKMVVTWQVRHLTHLTPSAADHRAGYSRPHLKGTFVP